MSRTYRDIRQIKYKLLGELWFGQGVEPVQWHTRPREYRQAEDQIGYSFYYRGMYSKYWRIKANRKDRRRIKTALHLRDLERYFQRRQYDDDGW